MYKKVEDIFSSADGNRTVVHTPPSLNAPATVKDTVKKPYNQMTDAEAIRSMGDRLSAIWGNK
jgi:hypothetical protein